MPNDVRDWCMATTRKGKLAHEKWNQDLAVYATSNPVLYREFNTFFDKKKLDLDKLSRNAYKWEGLSGRELNHLILNEICPKLSCVIGGNADNSLLTECKIDNVGYFSTANRRGRNIHFGTRHEAMGAICNGLALYEDFYPFAGTLLAYASYMLPAIRLAAIMKINTMFVYTHDSVKIGQEGVAIQPIEQLANLRSIIGLKVFRPCDGNEMLAAYSLYLENNGPMALVLSKDKMDIVDGQYSEAMQGGYEIVHAEKDADIVIFASGSEVGLAIEVAKELNKKYAVSVVSMPCLEVFEEQSYAYKTKLLQPNAKLKVAIEASNDNVWYKYVGENGLVVNLENYAVCGNGEDVYKLAGFDVKEIARKIIKKLTK